MSPSKPNMNTIPDSSLPLLQDLDTLIIDALRWQYHPSHNSVEQAMEWIARIRPRRAFLTHIAHELEHVETEAKLPNHVRLAYDGLRIPIEI